MANSDSLKKQNLPLVILFLCINVTVYILFASGFKNFWNEFDSLFTKVNAQKGVFIVVAPLVSLVLSGVLSADFKAHLVFWKTKFPLPGCRAFSDIAPNDTRVDLNIIQTRLNSIPSDPSEQNAVWYRIYKQVQGQTTVESVHKEFLLFRDLAAIAFLFLITTPWILVYVAKNVQLIIAYTLLCLLEYVVFCIVAQNAGKRFVGNVLAEYCCSQNNLQ